MNFLKKRGLTEISFFLKDESFMLRIFLAVGESVSLKDFTKLLFSLSHNGLDE